MTDSELLIFENQNGDVKLDVWLEDETSWLSQEQMGRLFGKSKKTVSEHIRNIFEEGELVEHSAVREFRTTATDGKNFDVGHCNLDVIISVRYREKSRQGTQFRIWATQRLKEYIIKGFVLNDERIRRPQMHLVGAENGASGNEFEPVVGADLCVCPQIGPVKKGGHIGPPLQTMTKSDW